MKKLVVFDLDGTLVDSIKDLANAVNFALKEFNLPLHPTEAYYLFVGNGMEALVRRSMGDESKNDELYLKVRKVFDTFYNAHNSDNTSAYVGVRELLETLKLKGIKVAVLTNKAHEFVGEILNKSFPGFSFDYYIGQQNNIERKPHPQSFEILLSALNISKKDCLYAGDSEVDVLTAKNAGVDLVAVTWGFRSAEALKNAGAEILVNNPKEILNYV